MRAQFVIPVLASILILGLVGTLDDAYAFLDLWIIHEVFSNSDGTIQYVELFTLSNDQEFLSGGGGTLTATSDGIPVVFTFPNDSGAPTADQHILIATPAFSNIPGAPTPDYTIPVQFFDPTAASIIINFGPGFDTLTFSGPGDLPTDDINSLNPDLSTSIGSPTNFNGDTLSLGIVSCGIPPPGLDWTITSNCTLASVTADRDVIVQSGVVMIIPNLVTLTLDRQQSLRVENGAGVLIESGGSIKFVTIPFSLSSNSFSAGGPIPAIFTCDNPDGIGISPNLNIQGVPPGTLSMALIMDDPDAPGPDPFVHWLMWNIPPTTLTFAEDETIAVTQGINDFLDIGYGGPCPPPNELHTYFFKLFALDNTLTLAPGSTKSQLETAMAVHILDQTTLTGTRIFIP